MSDPRRIPRSYIGKAAKILTEQGDAVECIVIDITTIGARLSIPYIDQVNEIFDLSFDNFRTVYSCRQIWKKDLVLGVELVKN